MKSNNFVYSQEIFFFSLKKTCLSYSFILLIFSFKVKDSFLSKVENNYLRLLLTKLIVLNIPLWKNNNKQTYNYILIYLVVATHFKTVGTASWWPALFLTTFCKCEESSCCNLECFPIVVWRRISAAQQPHYGWHVGTAGRKFMSSDNNQSHQ